MDLHFSKKPNKSRPYKGFKEHLQIGIEALIYKTTFEYWAKKVNFLKIMLYLSTSIYKKACMEWKKIYFCKKY